MRCKDNSGPSGADAVVADLAGVTGRSGDRPVSALPDALQSYAQIAAAVAARRPVVLLDFDGTLCDIVDNPDSASLSEGAVDALKALAAQCDVAVLSGRDVADLVSRVGLPGIWYGGSHGFQTAAPDGTEHHHLSDESVVGVLQHVAGELRKRFAPFDGVLVEHKRFAVAVHYRRVPDESVREVIATVHTVGQRAGLRLALDGAELDRWEDVSRRMFVPFQDRVISQSEGYEQLADLDWHAYRQRYGNIQRLDRILEAEDDNVNNYKASKQADALMLFYLLSSDELRELFDRLGCRFAPDQIPKTIDYYRSRTSHGSTLSAVVHSWALARGDRDRAMKYFQQVLMSDIADLQGGTTFEGIHLAARTGSVDLLQRCFTGLEFRAGRIVLAPLWPEELGRLAFPFRYRGHRLHLEINGRRAKVTSESEQSNAFDIECRGRVERLLPGHTVEFS